LQQSTQLPPCTPLAAELPSLPPRLHSTPTKFYSRRWSSHTRHHRPGVTRDVVAVETTALAPLPLSSTLRQGRLKIDAAVANAAPPSTPGAGATSSTRRGLPISFSPPLTSPDARVAFLDKLMCRAKVCSLFLSSTSAGANPSWSTRLLVTAVDSPEPLWNFT
jgi:hypothetical protein